MSGGISVEGGYRDLFADVLPPTAEQVRNFCGFVARAHSWYKKLPLVPPGEPFFLYLNPHVHECFVTLEPGQPGAWRAIVREPFAGRPGLSWFRVAADLDEQPMGLNYYAKGLTTVDYRERLHRWTFSNFGRPGQDRESAVRHATGRVEADDDLGHGVAVPTAVLELGLVYLRGTVSPTLGPMEDEYEELRRDAGAPQHEDDRDAQFQEMTTAMEHVITWIYGD